MRSYSRTRFKLEKFENAALFVRLGLPSTLICQENAAFRQHSSNRRNLKTPAFRLSVDDDDDDNDDVTIIMWYPWPSIHQTQMKQERWLFSAFLNYTGVVWTENTDLMGFQIEDAIFTQFLRSGPNYCYVWHHETQANYNSRWQCDPKMPERLVLCAGT